MNRILPPWTPLGPVSKAGYWFEGWLVTFYGRVVDWRSILCRN